MSKLERTAIYENSYRGMGLKDDTYFLNDREMDVLNGLDEGLKVGRLGVKDGWEEEDILDENWDPTDFC